MTILNNRIPKEDQSHFQEVEVEEVPREITGEELQQLLDDTIYEEEE